MPEAPLDRDKIFAENELAKELFPEAPVRLIGVLNYFRFGFSSDDILKEINRDRDSPEQQASLLRALSVLEANRDKFGLPPKE